jgi:hypothetical protein
LDQLNQVLDDLQGYVKDLEDEKNKEKIITANKSMIMSSRDSFGSGDKNEPCEQCESLQAELD